MIDNSAIIRLTSEADVLALISYLNTEGHEVALDIETTGLSSFTDQLLSINLSDGEEAWVFGPELAPHLAKLTAPLVLHNFKFDILFLFRKGIDLRHLPICDTMLLHHLLDENLPHGLDGLIQEYFKDNYKEVFWAKYKTVTEAPIEDQDAYSGRDAIYTHRLVQVLRDALIQDGVNSNLITQVHAFAKALLETEIEGVNLDIDRIIDLGVRAQGKLTQLNESMRALIPEELAVVERRLWAKELDKRKTDKGKAGVKQPVFSFDSNQQLQMLLYDVLKLPVQYSPKRTPTADDAALEKLEDYHPFIAQLRDYRGEQKIYTAFLEATIERSRDGKIYPSFNVNGTVTGRISSQNPNLQQLPRSGGIRSMYIPRAGYSFIGADFSSLEVTLAAHFSLDPNLLRVINEGISLHDITAEGLGIPRQLAKTINFAIQYGAGPKKIKKILKCSDKAAEAALEKYWATYPGLKTLVDKCHVCVDQGIALENPFGRKRRLVPQDPDNEWSVAAVKRQAFNSLIQGTGADITNLAFTRMSTKLLKSGEGRALFPIHDEILIEVRDDTVAYWESVLVQTMTGIAQEIGLRVPLTAESSGPMKRWED